MQKANLRSAWGGEGLPEGDTGGRVPGRQPSRRRVTEAEQPPPTGETGGQGVWCPRSEKQTAWGLVWQVAKVCYPESGPRGLGLSPSSATH